MILGRMVLNQFVLNTTPTNIPGLIDALPRVRIPQFAQELIHPSAARSPVDGAVLAQPFIAFFRFSSGAGGTLWVSNGGSSTRMQVPGPAAYFTVFYPAAAAVAAHKVPVQFIGSVTSL